MQVPPQLVLAPFSPVCRSSAPCHPPLSAGSPSEGTSPSQSVPCAGPPLCAVLSTPFCAGSPSVGSSSSDSSVQVPLSVEIFYPPPPAPCAGSPSGGSSPSQPILCAGRFSLCVSSLSLCRYIYPLFVQDPPLWVVPSLSLCKSLSLCRSIYPPLCAGSPSVGSSRSLLSVQVPLSLSTPLFVQVPP